MSKRASDREKILAHLLEVVRKVRPEAIINRKFCAFPEVTWGIIEQDEVVGEACSAWCEDDGMIYVFTRYTATASFPLMDPQCFEKIYDHLISIQRFCPSIENLAKRQIGGLSRNSVSIQDRSYFS